MKKRYVIAFISASLVFIILLALFSKLTEPKYIDSSREGNLIAEYYRETDAGNTHDVIFVGDCEAYSAFSPPILYEEYGIRSFVRGSPSQTVEQSYCLILEALKYERPRAVVLSVYSLCKAEHSREAYNRMTLDGMRLSAEKLHALYESIGEGESALSYLIPLLRFHSRIYELKDEDLQYLFSRPRVSHNGYFMQKGVVAQESEEVYESPEADPIAAITPIPEKNLDCLDKILAACRERGVELILVKSPISSWRYPWYEEWDGAISAYAAERGIAYYNLIEKSDSIGIDMARDSYDGGFHLNLWGAEKTSRYFGAILYDRHGITGGESAVWEKKLDEYYKERNNEEN